MNYTYEKIYTGAGAPKPAMVTREEAVRTIAALTVKDEAFVNGRILCAEERVLSEVVAQSCEQFYDVAARVPGKSGPVFIIRVRPEPRTIMNESKHSLGPWEIQQAEHALAESVARAMLATAAHHAPEARTHDDNVFLMGYQLGKIDALTEQIKSTLAVDSDPDGGVFEAAR